MPTLAASPRGLLVATLLPLFLCSACTQRLYDGPELPAEDVAVVHVGDTSVLDVDGQFSFALPVGVTRFEVAPGPHRIVLAFARPATTIGLRDIPEQRGEGTCTIDFVAEAGKQYWLGSRAVGANWAMRRWDGEWEGWIRDPSVSAEDDIVARCQSRGADEVAPPRGAASPVPAPPAPTPEVRAASPTTPPAAAPAVAPAPVAPAPPAAMPAAMPAAPAAPPQPTAPPSAPQAAASGAGPEWIRLGTWNLRRLGSDGDRAYDAIAAVIDANFDILTLTELAHRDGGHPGYDRLLGALGDGWAGMVTETAHPSTDGEGGEHYAIVYRRDVASPCPGWRTLREVGASDRFRRPPAYACFEVGPNAGAPQLDFLLAAYRAVVDEDADVVAAEVRNLDAALDEMSRSRPGDRDLIVAGQFHLEASELALVTSARPRTSGGGAALNLLGEPSPLLRDHVLVRTPRATLTMTEGAAIDVRSIAASPRAFRDKVSDHLPVMIRIEVDDRDAD